MPGDYPVGEDASRTVDIGEERFQGFDALHYAPFELLPLLLDDQTGNQV